MDDLQFGPFTLSPLERQLRRGEEAIPVPAKAFDLLLLLARNPGKPLTRKELLRSVWADTHVEESTLNQSVFVLRKALGVEGEGVLITIPGIGYQFASRVTAVPQAPRHMTIQTTESHLTLEEVTEERIHWWRSPLVLTLASAGVVLLGVAGWLGWERYEDRTGGPPVQVVIADSDGTTGDAVLDRTLSAVFRGKLAQSPHISLLSISSVKAKLVEMQHKADDPLSLAMAREVCERTGSQAVVQGSVAHAGAAYVVTEEATNCVDGTSLGEANETVAKAEQLPTALSRVADKIRHDLGESRRTIARFNQPLKPVTTRSLEALKDLTEAERLMALGRGPEAVDLLKQSVALDQTFAGAWLDLSTYALNNRDRKNGVEYLTKAYNLRQDATEPTRRLITARYNGEVTGDLYESLRNYQSWVDEYPRSIVPWSGMSVVDHDLGRTSEELNSAQRLMALNQNFQQIYFTLANAQIRAGDFAAARATAQAGIAKGLDGDPLRQILLHVGHVTNDPALIAEQESWALKNPFSPYTLSSMAEFAELEGRIGLADRLQAMAVDACRHLGNDDLRNDSIAQLVMDRSGLGLPEKAKDLLAQMTPDPTDAAYLYALEYGGQEGKVEPLLQQQLAANPRSTKWNEFYGPALHAKLLMDAGKPKDALTALEPTSTHNESQIEGNYLRGTAYLQMGKLPEAEAEFRTILDHPGVEPVSWQRPMALVQLARTLAREQKKAEAAAAYRKFLASWAQAATDHPLLLQVRKELQALQT